MVLLLTGDLNALPRGFLGARPQIGSRHLKELGGSRMAPSRTIASFFRSPKRLKGVSDPPRALQTVADPCSGTASATGDDGSGFLFRKLSNEELAPEPAFKFEKDGSAYSFRKITEEDELSDRREKEQQIAEEAIRSDDRDQIPVDAKQKVRMDLNKSMACAKRALRLCEEVVQASQGGFPNLRNLLVEPTWLEVLKDEFTKPYMAKLQAFVKEEAAGKHPIYPPAARIFHAFNSCPFERVKVVLLGQDPYHGAGQAMGLSFSVPVGEKVPPSLQNMYKEIHEDVGCSIPKHGNLEKWAHQGVVLLNTVLTVRAHQANSHAKKGWEAFTDAAIRAISSKRRGVVFLLWGNSAQEKIRLIDTNAHHILRAAHPSGLSAHKGFFKCRHFSKTNKLLEAAGMLPIEWQL